MSALPTPYYDREGITIYHGDCREILPQREADSVDVVVTDPPYPGLKGGTQYAFDGVAKRSAVTTTVGMPWQSDLEWMPDAWNVARLGMMVFCSYHSVSEVAASLPAESRVALLTWYKRNAPPAITNVPRFTTEFVWLFKKSPGLRWREIKNTMIDIPMLQSGCMAGERLRNADGSTVHQTQKPESLMRTLLSVDGDTILDPFMGTGTTLLAAKQLGKRAIGIEIEEKYCEIAVKRLSQMVLPLWGVS